MALALASTTAPRSFQLSIASCQLPRARKCAWSPTQPRTPATATRLLAYVYKPGRSGPTGSVNHSLVRERPRQGLRLRRRALPLRSALLQSPAPSPAGQAWPLGAAVPRQHEEAGSLAAGTRAPPATPAAAPEPAQPRSDATRTTRAPASRLIRLTWTAARSPIGTSPAWEDPHNFDVDHDGIACEELEEGSPPRASTASWPDRKGPTPPDTAPALRFCAASQLRRRVGTTLVASLDVRTPIVDYAADVIENR